MGAKPTQCAVAGVGQNRKRRFAARTATNRRSFLERRGYRFAAPIRISMKSFSFMPTRPPRREAGLLTCDRMPSLYSAREISNGSAVRGRGARDDTLSVEIVEPCDTRLVHTAAGITEEHSVDVQRNRIVRTTSGKRAV